MKNKTLDEFMKTENQEAIGWLDKHIKLSPIELKSFPIGSNFRRVYDEWRKFADEHGFLDENTNKYREWLIENAMKLSEEDEKMI